MKHTLAAILLSAFAGAAFAQTVATPQDCPAGTTSVHANYKWQDGRFVRDGWVCETINARS